MVNLLQRKNISTQITFTKKLLSLKSLSVNSSQMNLITKMISMLKMRLFYYSMNNKNRILTSLLILALMRAMNKANSWSLMIMLRLIKTNLSLISTIRTSIYPYLSHKQTAQIVIARHVTNIQIKALGRSNWWAPRRYQEF